MTLKRYMLSFLIHKIVSRQWLHVISVVIIGRNWNKWNRIYDHERFIISIKTAWKVTAYGVFSGPYFSVLGLNREIYGVNLRIQLEYGNIRTRKNSVFGHFSRSAIKRTQFPLALAWLPYWIRIYWTNMSGWKILLIFNNRKKCCFKF